MLFLPQFMKEAVYKSLELFSLMRSKRAERSTRFHACP